ncbi:unnamed protein product [Rodentolepis nana]|uniref:Phage protein n=1 Tax=Rodentolepis nana TaxID=102285 RepID=A0A0R3TY54_RODNA|nr:unnamed protein product [Rodentolepis nana]
MKWKKAKCRKLLALPRPYPRDLYPEDVLDPDGDRNYTVDYMVETSNRHVISHHLLHIVEVEKEFDIEGVESYNK